MTHTVLTGGCGGMYFALMRWCGYMSFSNTIRSLAPVLVTSTPARPKAGHA